MEGDAGDRPHRRAELNRYGHGGSSPGFGAPVTWKDFRAGDRAVRYSDWSEVHGTFFGGIGNSELDLTALQVPPPAAVALEIDAKAASVEVRLRSP